MGAKADEERAGVKLTNLDQPLSPDAGATKRDLVDYLDAVADRMLPGLADRPLTVLRMLRGQKPFMQKNVPKYTPDWVKTVPIWAEASKREVHYALCDDRRTLLWFGNQRAIEYHPTLGLADNIYRPTHMVLDLDPPADDDFAAVVAVAHLVRQALVGQRSVGGGEDQRRQGNSRLRTDRRFRPGRGCRGSDPRARGTGGGTRPRHATTAFIVDDRGGKVFVDSTRAGGATVAAAYSPRLRPGTPVSFPLDWSDLDRVNPADFTVHTAIDALGGRDPWAETMGEPAAPANRFDRTGPHHPGCPGGRHARRQASRPRSTARGLAQRFHAWRSVRSIR